MAKSLLFILVWFVVFSCPVKAQSPSFSSLSAVEALIEKGEYVLAIQEARTALEGGESLDSTRQYLILLGQALLEENQLEEARTQFQEVLNLSKGQGTYAMLLRADAWNGLGEYFLKTGNWAKALEYHRQALKVREEILGRETKESAEAYHNLGDGYLVSGDYPQAAKFHTRALEIREAVLPPNHPDLAMSYNSLGNGAFFLKNYPDAIRYYEKALALRRDALGEKHPKTTEVYQNLGRAFFESGEYEAALYNYKIGLDILIARSGAEYPGLASLYEKIGDVLFEQFEVREAESFFHRADSLYTDENPAEKAGLKHKLGLCLQSRGEDAEALAFHLEALLGLEKHYGIAHPELAPVLNNVGNGLVHQEDFGGALPYLLRAAEIFSAGFPGGHPGLVQSLNSAAVCYLRLRRPSEAMRLLRQASGLLENPKIYTIEGESLTLKNRAMVEGNQGRSETALSLVRTALGLLWPDRNIGNVNRVLTPEILSLLIMESRLIQRTGGKPQDAAALLETALQLSNRLRLPLSENGCSQWAEATYALYSTAVEINFQAWKLHGKKAFLERAFQLSEQYKSQTLLEAIRQTQAVKFKGIPSRLFLEKSQLEAELGILEKQRWVALQRELSDREAALGRRIGEVRKKLEETRKQLIGESPEYSRLFENSKRPSVASLRKVLDPNQALLEYFTTDSLIFLFVMTRDTLQGVQFRKDFPLEAWVADFREMIKAYPGGSGKEREAQALRWSGRSYQLYRRLLAPAMGQIRLPDRLIIVPDGLLHYLPFESLLTQSPLNATHFKTHAYMGIRHILSYAYSAQLLLELKGIEPRGRFWGKYVLSVAPDFSGNSFALSPLAHNRWESDAVRGLMGGRQLKGKEATLYNFLSLAPEYRVLHLATHALAAPGYEEFSFLAFTERPDKKDNEFLYARDLYNLQLKCDLVVLSACEAEVGAFRQGEGILGLGRGFFYAGAQSLMNTLWSVDESRTAALVQRCFYYLRRGFPKDVALHRAKKDFLEKHPHAEAHPVYWSGLLLSGDTKSLPDPRLQWVISWFLALSGLGLAITLYWRWIRKRSVLR